MRTRQPVLRIVASICVVSALVLGGQDSAGAEATTGRSSAMGDTATNDSEPQSLTQIVTVTTPTHPNFLYVSGPSALGYWEDEQLDVTLEFTNGSAAGIQAMVGGRGDVIVGTPVVTLYGPYVQGFETIGFYNTTPGNFNYPVVPVDSDIESIADVEGKTIGVISLETGSVGLFNAMAAAAGLTPDDYTFVAVGSGASAASALFDQGSIDVLMLWADQYAIIESVDASYVVRRLESDVNDAALGLTPAVAVREAFDADPDLFVRWARAVAKASVFAQENPDAATAVHSACYPESVPSADSADAAQEIALRIFQARFDTAMDIDAVEEVERWGEFVPEFVDAYDEQIADVEQPAFDGDHRELFTNDLIDQINDFDEEEVRTRAREWSDADIEAARANCP